MLYPRVIWAVSVTPWTIILVGVKFLTFQPKAEHIRTGILFIEDPFYKNAPFFLASFQGGEASRTSDRPRHIKNSRRRERFEIP